MPLPLDGIPYLLNKYMFCSQTTLTILRSFSWTRAWVLSTSFLVLSSTAYCRQMVKALTGFKNGCTNWLHSFPPTFEFPQFKSPRLLLNLLQSIHHSPSVRFVIQLTFKSREMNKGRFVYGENELYGGIALREIHFKSGENVCNRVQKRLEIQNEYLLSHFWTIFVEHQRELKRWHVNKLPNKQVWTQHACGIWLNFC